MGIGLLLGAAVVGYRTSVLWALGWTVTTLGGIEVARQFTVFGAYRALTFSALSGVLLHHLLPFGAGIDPRPAQPPVEATV